MRSAAENSIVIRDIVSISEMRCVEELQKEVWGVPDLDVVPLTQLAAAVASGGVLIGAFDKDDLVGFAYGFVGWEKNLFVHHSHMLAIKPEHRGHDLGLSLKLAQRDRVLEQGIEVMTWTFDPLRSLNAYFNFNKLGVVSDRYFVNFYGEEAPSFLHRNGTDRLWVTWHLTSKRVAARLNERKAAALPPGIKVLVEAGENGTPPIRDHADLRSHDRLAIEIPANIGVIESENANIALEWRQITRAAFQDALRNGFFVEDFYRTGSRSQGAGSYVLTRKIP